MNPSNGVARLTAVRKRIQENNQGQLLLLKNDEHVITFPIPRRNGIVKEIDYMKYDFAVDVTDFVIFFRDYSDQLVVLTLFDNSVIIVRHNQ